MQDYKSLHFTIMICVSLVNAQTHTVPGFKKTRFKKKSPTQRVFWVLMGFIELWVFLGFFPMDKWVAPSRDSLDRMHLTL